MPENGFLQRFHELAQADPEVRARASLGVKRAVAKYSAKGGEEGAAQEVEYALKRLVRGVQSSRQCCRQGFSLALTEVLRSVPDELKGVLVLIRQETQLQKGLKPKDEKERLVGRLLGYAAILEAGCLGQGQERVATEIAQGLREIYVAREYFRAPAALMLVDLCRRLCATELVAAVPEAVAKWSLDEKVSAEIKDTQAAGIALELRGAYEEAERAGIARAVLKAWPACVRSDLFAAPETLDNFVRSLGAMLSSVSLDEAVPFELGSFCRWWFKRARTDGSERLQQHVWSLLNGSLFPERASNTIHAQGLRAFAEIATLLREAGAAEGGAALEPLLRAMFEQMPRGLGILFEALSWKRSHAHLAASYAQGRLLAALGDSAAPGPAQGGNKKKSPKGAPSPPPPPAWTLGDKTRLAILASLQQQEQFGAMRLVFQRQWQETLLAPLSMAGIRKRCAALFAGLQEELASRGAAGEEGADRTSLANVGSYSDQILHLATHGRAPDEVILSVVCLLFASGYFAPAGGRGFSLKAFCAAVGVPVAPEAKDIIVPVLRTAAATEGDADAAGAADAKNYAHWRAKLWSVLTSLLRRTTPEMAEKIAGAGDGAAASADGPVMRTPQFNGCLADGSLWALRLHEWWDHLLKGEGAPPASPKLSAKKRRRLEGGGASLSCVVALSEEDLALRRRCIDLCRGTLGQPEGEGSLAPRQRNALCTLPLTIALAMLDAGDEEERESSREQLKDVNEALEKLNDTPGHAESAKRLAKLQKQRAEVLQSVPRLAAELFVSSAGLVKEAARTAWRELGEYTPDETVLSLCASIQDAEEEDEDEDDEHADGGDDDDSEGEGLTTEAQAARAAQFAQATEAIRRAREAAGDAGKGDGDDDDDDEVVLEGDALWQQLADDGAEGEGGEGSMSLLNTFASSGLEGEEAVKPKLTKRQQRLRRKQEEIVRKLREIELLELFLARFAEKRKVIVQVIQGLYKALLAVGRKPGAGGAAKEGESAETTKESKGKRKADALLKRLEGDLSQRIAQTLTKTMKLLCRGPALSKISSWHSGDEWAGFAKAMYSTGEGPQAASIGERAINVGSLLLYWLCAAHRAQSLGAAPDAAAEGGDDAGAPSTGSTAGWSFAEELLGTVLQDWSVKRDSDPWCSAVLRAFAPRVPHVLVRLPWAAQVRSCRKAYVQRTQLALVGSQLLPGLQPETVAGTTFVADIAVLCAELLEGTFGGGSAEGGMSSSQSQKLRREALHCLNLCVRMQSRRKSRDGAPSPAFPLPKQTTDRIAAVVTKVRDSTTEARSMVYKFCVFILRDLRQRGVATGGANSPKLKGKTTEGGLVSADAHPRKKHKHVKRSSSGEEPRAKRQHAG